MAVTVGILFLLALFLSPLAELIPAFATAPAIMFIACLMTKAFIDVNWKDFTEYAPAVITALTMPLTYSVAEGIAYGFISYTVLKILTGRWKELNPAVLGLTLIFVLKNIFFS